MFATWNHAALSRYAPGGLRNDRRAWHLSLTTGKNTH